MPLGPSGRSHHGLSSGATRRRRAYQCVGGCRAPDNRKPNTRMSDSSAVAIGQETYPPAGLPKEPNRKGYANQEQRYA